jgi:hypothetical protein
LHSILLIAAAAPMLAVAQSLASQFSSQVPQAVSAIAAEPLIILAKLVPGLVLGWFTRRHPLVVGGLAGVLAALAASFLPGASFESYALAGNATATGFTVAVAALAGRALRFRFQPSNYAFKPTAGEVVRINQPLRAGGGLTRR